MKFDHHPGRDIPHRPGQSQFGGEAVHEGAETHPLHGTVHCDPAMPHVRFFLVHTVSIPCAARASTAGRRQAGTGRASVNTRTSAAPAASQDPHAFSDRGPRREQVIYHEHAPPAHASPGGHGEGAADVRGAGDSRQVHLGPSWTSALQQRFQRLIQSGGHLLREQLGLIEPAFPQAITMQWHRGEHLYFGRL